MSCRVFVVMPTRNRSSLLATALNRALQAPVSKVVVVNNASTDDTLHVLARCGDSRLVVLNQEKNYGCAGAIYIGMRWSVAHGADATWVLDDDLFVEPSALPQLVGATDLRMPVIVHPHLLWRTRNELAGPVPPLFGRGVGPTIPTSLPLTGSLVATAAIQVAGLPNWRFVNGFEDVEYIERAKRLGVNVVEADVKVGSHPVPRYTELRSMGRRYWRETQPLFRLRTTTRNALYTALRTQGASASALVVRRDVAGALVWATRLYGRHGWQARLAIIGGAVSGLGSSVFGSLDNRARDEGPVGRPHEALGQRG